MLEGGMPTGDVPRLNQGTQEAPNAKLRQEYASYCGYELNQPLIAGMGGQRLFVIVYRECGCCLPVRSLSKLCSIHGRAAPASQCLSNRPWNEIQSCLHPP